MIEGLKDYLKIHLGETKPLVIRMSLKSIEEKLPPGKFSAFINPTSSRYHMLLLFAGIQCSQSWNYPE